MKHFIIIVISFALFSNSNFAQTYQSDFLDGEIHMKVSDSFQGQLTLSETLLSTLIPTYGIDTLYYPFTDLSNDTLENTCRIKFSNVALTGQLLSALYTLPYCDYAELSPLYTTTFTPNDVNANQWYLQTIQAFNAWNISQGSQDVVIAIVDNAVRITHEDLQDNIWINTGEIPNNGIDDDLNGYVDDRFGYDVADRNSNPAPPAGINSSDAFNHGTHCAGIAAAVTNNGKGVASIGFKAKIMAVKCTRDSGPGNVLHNSIDGVTYAMRNNADIISMSFASSGNSITNELLFKTAHARGIVLIGAAGNDNTSTPYYPAAYANVFAVGATNENDEKASFSNFGSYINIMAPGVNIYSTKAASDSDYGFNSGTSMACPLVAGLASLVLAERPNYSPQQVYAELSQNADNISAQNPGFNGQLGSGRINAFKTLQSFTSNVSIDALDNDLKIFPVPATNDLFIVGDGIDSFKLYDVSGNTLDVPADISDEQIILDLTFLAQGVYFIQLQTNNTLVTQRILKY